MIRSQMTSSLARANHAIMLMGAATAALAVTTYMSGQFDDLIDRFSLAMFIAASITCVVAVNYPVGARSGRIACVIVPIAFASRAALNLVAAPPNVDGWNIATRVNLWTYAAWITWTALVRWIIPVRDLASAGVRVEQIAA